MAASAASSMMPPARILDLDVEVLTDSRQLEFSWTAPGEDFDQGEPQKKGHPGCPHLVRVAKNNPVESLPK